MIHGLHLSSTHCLGCSSKAVTYWEDKLVYWVHLMARKWRKALCRHENIENIKTSTRPLRLTWTLLDAEGSIGVFGPEVVFQLEGDGVVEEWLWTLGHTRPAVIEVGTGLQTKRWSKESSLKLKLALPLLTHIKNLDVAFSLFAVTNEWRKLEIHYKKMCE